MDNGGCQQVKEKLMLGLSDEVAEHLERCSDCREEAAHVRALLETLAESREVDPPATIDAAIQDAIRETRRVTPPLRYPYAALALAVGSVVMFAVGISSALSPTSLGDAAPAIVFPITVAYLALSSAASLPLLLRRFSRRALEVQS